MIVVGSAVPALLWGVAFANIVQGVPLDADHEFTGSLLTLLNPYGLLGGLTTLLLFFTHGVYFVALKTDGQVHEDARRLARRSGMLTVVVAAAFLVWTIFIAAGHGAPLMAGVIACAALAAIALVAVAGVQPARPRGLGVRLRRGHDRGRRADPVVRAVPLRHAVLDRHRDSLTIENASSTDYTLTIMSWAALIFLPLVLAYQAWTYWIFRKRVSRSRIEKAAAVAAH